MAELSGYRYCQDYPLTTVSIAGEQGTFEVKQTYIMVNPNSKKKEQAIAYLEAMYQNPVVGEDIFLFPNEDYPEIQELMEHHACYSLEYSDKIREMNMLLKPFLEADMSEDEAIEKLTEYAKGLQE